MQTAQTEGGGSAMKIVPYDETAYRMDHPKDERYVS